MPVVESKYSGTPEHTAVLALLIKAATTQRSTIGYTDVFRVMRLGFGNHAASEAGHLLGEISECMHGKGMPMLTAIVVGKRTGLPGKGFFDLAVALGKLPIGSGDRAKREFWVAECTAIFAAAWTR